MRRPVIGVTGPDRGGIAAWIFTATSVILAGGRPRWLRPRETPGRVRLDGLVLGGGADVDPALYGGSSSARPDASRSRPRMPGAGLVSPLVWLLRRLFSAKAARVDAARDRLETALLGRALRGRRPVLGICRGAQLLNVHLGGTLHPDATGLYVETPEIRSVLPRRRIRIEPGSRLARALGTAACRVNALHRQAIRELGRDLVVSARDGNGIVQAVEHTRHPFCIGVQWHPEFLPQHARQRRLVRELVAVAASRSGPRPPDP